MEKIFRSFKILKKIDSYLINILSGKELTALLLLVVVAVENNGTGKFKPETIKKFADKYFSGKDLLVICKLLRKFGWGRLTCCKQNNPQNPPCLSEKWKDLPIGISFSD
ncbi:hypothetical protein KAS42_00760 [bacterium]|nr:hypothetical protein [bacterium]